MRWYHCMLIRVSWSTHTLCGPTSRVLFFLFFFEVSPRLFENWLMWYRLEIRWSGIEDGGLGLTINQIGQSRVFTHNPPWRWRGYERVSIQWFRNCTQYQRFGCCAGANDTLSYASSTIWYHSSLAIRQTSFPCLFYKPTHHWHLHTCSLWGW